MILLLPKLLPTIWEIWGNEREITEEAL